MIVDTSLNETLHADCPSLFPEVESPLLSQFPVTVEGYSTRTTKIPKEDIEWEEEEVGEEHSCDSFAST